MKNYALHFKIVLYFQEEDNKATNVSLSFSLTQLKFPNKCQKRGLFPKCSNLCEVIPPLPSGGWGAAWACWFCIPLPCRVESCFLILQITMAICHLQVLKKSSFKSNKFNLLISTNQLKKNKLVSINEFLLPVRYWTLLVCQLNCKNQQLCHKSSFNYIRRVPFLLEESIFLKNDLLFKA